jgi:phage recombination protein Bet
MTGTGNGLAVRDQRAVAQAAPVGALAIEAGQTAWTPMQLAAFGQLGIADAPEGDKQVLLHVAQRTGLDPFARQIYMIGRNEKKSVKQPGGRWEDVWTVKYGIQTGIEGFRVIRARAERAEGIRGILSRPVYYDAEGNEYKAWLSRGVPVAVEMTYTAIDRAGRETPYTSILRFDEYRQTRKETSNGAEQQVLSGQWAVKPTHMLEKCAEADVYRKAFPQDYSGVDLDDAMPEPDWENMPEAELDARARAVGYRPRVTAEQARARAPQHVTATATAVAPNVPPAAAEAPAAAVPHPPAEAAGGTLPPHVETLAARLDGLGVHGLDAQLRTAGRLAGRKFRYASEVGDADAAGIILALKGCETPEDLDGVLADLAMTGGPRGEAASDGA